MVKPHVRLGAAVRREQVLAAAVPVFARHGYRATGTRQLAAAAGVAEPILYRHFGSKAGLFAAALATVTQRLERALEAVVAGSGGEPLRALAGGLPGILRTHANELRVLCGAASSHADAIQARAARRALTRIGRVLARLLAGAGLRRGVDAATAGFFLLELGLGSALLRPLGVSTVLHPRFGEQVVAWVTQALLAPRRS